MNTEHLWGIVLAGGEGKRLAGYIRAEYGSSMPKQFCSFTGTRSMLRHTIDRAQRLISPDHLLTIISRPHRQYALEQLGDRPAGTVIEQPSILDTGPGIYYPLLHVYARDPEAVVALFPSDHYILEEDLFLQYIRYAGEFVACYPRHILLLGVEPYQTETDYGWMEIDEQVMENGWHDIHAVNRFVEKPSRSDAEKLPIARSLWNTMVCISGVRTLCEQIEHFCPALHSAFEGVRRVLNTPDEEREKENAYTLLSPVNFSFEVLSHVPAGLCALRMTHVYWSDWGDPRRIRSDIDRLSYVHRTIAPSVASASRHRPLRARAGSRKVSTASVGPLTSPGTDLPGAENI